MNKKPTVTVGIPAHNEAITIKQLLLSILDQDQSNFKLKKVYVYCDGCTDNTAEEARTIARKSRKITVVEDGERLGKTKRLNQLYSSFDTDYVFNFDGDIVLADNRVMSSMIAHFREGIGMVSADNLPARARNFFQSITNAGDLMWREIRTSYKKGQNIYNCSGCASVLTKSFATTFRYKQSVVADQQYVYHSLKNAGYEFIHARDAIVYYVDPDNLHDYLLQASRSIDEKHPIIEIFGEGAESEYIIPFEYKLRGIVTSLARNPLFTTLSIGLALVLRFIPLQEDELHKKGMWHMVSSTKQVIERNNL